MFYITEFATRKKKIWLWVLISVCALAVICALSLFINYKTAFSRAIKNIDVNKQDTVVTAMKYAHKNPWVLTDIAIKYSDAKMYDKASLVCMYILEYLEPTDQTYAVFEDAIVKGGGQISYAEQFKDLQLTPQEFEVITQNEQGGYGIADGIYTEFLGGYAKAKISPALPIDIYAADGGAYFLDSSDRLIKFISQNGSKLLVKSAQSAREFVYFNGKLYYINQSGTVFKDELAYSKPGEVCGNLRIQAGKVICTVYTNDYESVKDITL